MMCELVGIKKFKVLVVDRDSDTHEITELVLGKMRIDDSMIDLYHSYSESETIKMLSEIKDFAMIIMDIDLENENSGYKIIEYVRNEMKDDSIYISVHTNNKDLTKASEEINLASSGAVNNYMTKNRMDLTMMRMMVMVGIRHHSHVSRLIEKYRKMKEVTGSNGVGLS